MDDSVNMIGESVMVNEIVMSNISVMRNRSVMGNVSILGLDEIDSNEALANVELFIGYPDALVTFASVCCYIFMVIGIPGNIITIVALARCKKVRNATAIFIISLSFSDLLFCCFNLPLAASTFWNQSWTHGKTLCKMFPMARYALVAVSLFTVLAITINRYIMIARPRLYPKLYTKKYLMLMIAGLWFFCFAALLPTWFEKWGRFSLDPVIGSCTIVPDAHNNSPKKVLFICALLVPGLAILACYARIFWIVKKVGKRSRSVRINARTRIVTGVSSELNTELNSMPSKVKHVSLPPKLCHNPFQCLAIPETSSIIDNSATEEKSEEHEKRITDKDRFLSRSSEAIQKLRIALKPAPKKPKAQKLLPSKKDRKLRTLIMAIMLSFVICHLPISVTKIFLEFTTHPFVNIASYITLYLTTCINPIVYVVMSNEYRQAYKNLIACRRGDHNFPESTVLRRITSMKNISTIRQSKRQLHLVNSQLPT